MEAFSEQVAAVNERPAVEAGRIAEAPASPPAAKFSWEVNKNPQPDPDQTGADLWFASAREVPGLVVFGRTEAEAKELGIKTALQRYAASSAETRNRLDQVQALVQFNHRISAEEKTRIVIRAREVGLSVRQFMLNQCLHAPVWQNDSPMPTEDKQRTWQAMARAGSSRNQSASSEQ